MASKAKFRQHVISIAIGAGFSDDGCLHSCSQACLELGRADADSWESVACRCTPRPRCEWYQPDDDPCWPGCRIGRRHDGKRWTIIDTFL
ncbi:unnamed protein product [Protopolystoma xenopodis]|uniref:Uncharacterized protein n=1 Tax=Protopolystoma xenopodis TaxID=117903 RepID=A0A3S4ZQ90_9PLAT|nr:unnamed protein product [Protopolystoma xenopodis]